MYFLSRALAAPLFDRVELCKFCRWHHEEQFCEIILNLDKWFSRYFFIWSSGGSFVQQRCNVWTIVVKGIMRNNSVKLVWIWTSGSGGNVIKRHFLSRALAAHLFGGAKPFVQFW